MEAKEKEKRAILLEKLEEINRRLSISKGTLYKELMHIIAETNGKGYKIRPVKKCSPDRSIEYFDSSKFYVCFLDFLGFKYRQGNDSQDGNCLGKYIEILTEIYD